MNTNWIDTSVTRNRFVTCSNLACFEVIAILIVSVSLELLLLVFERVKTPFRVC